MRGLKSSITAFLAIASVVVGGVGLASAASQTPTDSGQSLTLSPASTSPSVPPGGSYSGSMSILDNGSSDYTVSLYASPYHVSGVDYDPSFTQLPGTTDPSKWVHLGKTALKVPAGETVVAPYTLSVPAQTAPGGYYAVIFAETQPSPGAGVTSRSRVGNILYITVQGNVRRGGYVNNTSLPHFSMDSSVPLSLEVSNTGGVHFLTNAKITATDLFGKEVFRGTYQRYVLPQTTRRISANFTTPPFGFYHIARSATVAGKTVTLPTSWIFIIHPWVAVLLGILLVLIIAGIWLPMFRRRKSRARP